MFGTAAAAAEGGRDTRVLGDPMDLIRCQKLPGKAQWHTVQTSTNLAQYAEVRQDGENNMIREMEEANSFSIR